jgi:hypothetical protein
MLAWPYPLDDIGTRFLALLFLLFLSFTLNNPLLLLLSWPFSSAPTGPD